MTTLRVERLDGADRGILMLGLERPEAKNALGRQLLQDIQEALAAAAGGLAVRVVIVHSLVPGVFCAGADLKERAGMTQDEARAFVQTLRSTFTDLERLPMPTIAAIEGAALGGGLELALACDLRVVGGSAKLGLPETSLAIIPGAGGTQRLPRLTGRSRAKELIFTARKFGAAEALAYGIADHITEAGMALASALQLAREILPNGPIALRAAKEAIDRGLDLDRDGGLGIEEACYAKVIPTEDRLEGLAAFREKRRPVYRGR
ncbi:MAG: enoyl-CoA hydratase/isomerase family protein [Holophagaceae bacterium]|nr:enoyl-CoA hydratase/isomerase family protein [Holophagaceae bacterium]